MKLMREPEYELRLTWGGAIVGAIVFVNEGGK